MKKQMDSKILLGKILQRFEDKGYAKVAELNRFVRVEESNSQLMILRENNNTTRVDFKKIVIGIEFYQRNPEAYDKGPKALRDAGLTHVTSPIFALLHLLRKDAYHGY
jgi:hypothetical protein